MVPNFQAELGKPNPLQTGRGKVTIYVDCSPTATPAFEVIKKYFYSQYFLLKRTLLLLKCALIVLVNNYFRGEEAKSSLLSSQLHFKNACLVAGVGQV